jgi:hypothetical protein
MRPLTKATRGVLKGGSAKKVLVLAMAGTMYFTSGIVEPPTPPSGGGGGGYYQTEAYKPNEQEERRKRILIEDSILVQIVEITLKTTII